MIVSSLPPIWASMQSWLTPTVLFILVNVAIVTIFFFSITQKQEQPTKHPKPQLSRTSSFLQTLASFNLYRQKTQENLTIPPQESIEPIGTVDLPGPHDQTHLSRIQSDTHPTAGEVPEKLPQKMKKSASENSAFDHFKEESVGGPSSVRGRQDSRGDEKVDEKADDFINRFKQQLKLQRLDSLLRYKEMLNRGN